MNKNILRSKMALRGDRYATLADAIGISQQRLSAKINEKNGAEFRLREVIMIKNRYNLSTSEVESIFFAS